MQDREDWTTTEEIFVCECTDLNHHMVLTVDTEHDPFYVEAYLYCKLTPRHSFFTRAWQSIKYSLGVGQADYTGVLLNAETRDKLVDALKNIKYNTK